MLLDALEDLFNINFSPDLDIEFLTFTKIEEEKKFKKEGEVLYLNLAELDPEQRKEVITLAQDQFKEKGRVLRHDEENETNAIEAGYTEDFGEIVNYFDGILSERYLTILESSLYLRALIDEENLSKEEIDERKRELTKKNGAESIYLSSLTSAGYFDPDGGLRDLYVELELNDRYDRYEFQPILSELVEEKLICLFVEKDEDIYDVTQEARRRLVKYKRENPPQEWFDIRGIGDGCEEIIDGVMANLEEEFIGVDYDRWKIEDDLWVRIYPRSLPSNVNY